ncbi:hypothetical protein W97_07313 [Coniosporium apollinis CBS 100218]|uniref:RING-type domain-containing protein n=1 Tax=Coniosporium apollinis (strain CBS 100218) TaxID=1168221 RepID=R7Z2C1_CONA1|nr:uncharacterized protein W97_07313 [Coniosporium apollinis CBS 100218]EON68164.1 hypothetical protein W97_07313 [Coniosporium apollinis CBS 100218]
MTTYSDEEEFWRQTETCHPDLIPADDRNCPICGEAYEDPDNDPDVMAVGLQCSHFVCLNCLDHWLHTTIRGQVRNTCPVCRHVLYRVRQVTPDYTSDYADDDGSADEGEDSDSENSSENDDEMPDVDLDPDNDEDGTEHPSVDMALLREEHRWLARHMRDECIEHLVYLNSTRYWNGDHRLVTIDGLRQLPVWSLEPNVIRSEARETLRRDAIRIVSLEVCWTIHRLHNYETTARRMYQQLVHLVRCNAVVTMYGLAENEDESQWQVNDLSQLTREARRWIRNIVYTQMNPDAQYRSDPSLEFPYSAR